MAGREAIAFFNRLTGQVEEEVIYGEASLRWVYGSPLGRAALHTLVKRAAFSKIYGLLMDRPSSAAKIQPFITKYGLVEADFADAVESYSCFNDFFSRKLKPEARPLAGDDQTLVFPADGRHLLVRAGADFLVKGQRFDLPALLGDAALAAEFAGSDVLISRLCPTDYHRFHFPCAAVAGVPQLLNGALFSVSPLALVTRPSILWENKRYITRLDTANHGPVVFLEVGATCVGKVVHTSQPGPVLRGAEKGTFLFGGSTVITVIPFGAVDWAEDLRVHSAQNQELYSLMGSAAGTWLTR
jgi:phosphatidylserine decarboxylase